MDYAGSDLLPLDCVRGGGCCHAQRIPVTPWEIAILARALGLSPAVCRDRHTRAGGTCLAADAAGDCRLLGAGGCTVHAARPLACRLFPLGRRLDEGRPIYHMPGDGHRCSGLCPEALLRPPRQVAAWLGEQGVAPGETAHDAYGRLVCGLLNEVCNLGHVSVLGEIEVLANLPAGERAATLPRPWFELLTAPDLPVHLGGPSDFVLAHAERLLGAVAAGFAGDRRRAAVILATVAMQLGEPLGIEAQAAVSYLRRTASGEHRATA
jgi:Fe-S-cluster containining protein